MTGCTHQHKHSAAAAPEHGECTEAGCAFARASVHGEAGCPVWDGWMSSTKTSGRAELARQRPGSPSRGGWRHARWSDWPGAAPAGTGTGRRAKMPERGQCARASGQASSKVLIMATYHGGNGGRIWGKSQKWRGCRISWRNGGATRGVMGTNFGRAPDGSGPDTGVKSRC